MRCCIKLTEKQLKYLLMMQVLSFKTGAKVFRILKQAVKRPSAVDFCSTKSNSLFFSYPSKPRYTNLQILLFTWQHPLVAFVLLINSCAFVRSFVLYANLSAKTLLFNGFHVRLRKKLSMNMCTHTYIHPYKFCLMQKLYSFIILLFFSFLFELYCDTFCWCLKYN